MAPPRSIKEAKALATLPNGVEYAFVLRLDAVMAYKDKDGDRWLIVQGNDGKWYRTQD